MLDRETRERIADYFDGPELVDYLRLSCIDIIDAFEVEVEEALDDIEELIGVISDNDN